MAAIEETSRGSLVEMRRLLGVLRQGEEPSLAPSPGLAELPALVERVRRAGVTTTLETTGDLSQVPAGVDLSAYRIVQEALTNVVRHGGTNAQVNVASTDHDLHLEVIDDGDGTREPAALAVRRRGTDSSACASGSPSTVASSPPRGDLSGASG